MLLQYRIKTLLLAAAVASVLGGCDGKKTADDYLLSGESFFQQQEYEKARVEYRNALALDPANAAAHYGLAMVARQKKEQSALRYHLSRAVQFDPRNATIQFEFGELAVLTGDLAAVKKSLQALDALQPQSPQRYQLELALAIAENNWAEAERLSEKAQAMYPDHAELWGLTAVAAKKQQQWERALNALDRALSLDTENLQYRLLRVEVNRARGDMAATIADMTYLIGVSRDPEGQIIQLIKLLYERDGWEAAIDQLQKFVNQYPDAYALQTLHVDLVKQADPAGAGELLDRYIKAAKAPAGLLFYRTYAALANNYVDLAEQDLKTILANPAAGDKAHYEAKALLAEIAWVKEDWLGATQWVDQVLTANSEHMPALLLKSKLLLRENRGAEALVYMNKALSINPKSLEILALLAGHYITQNNTTVAADYYQRILELDAQHYEANRFVIADAFAKGHLANADALLEKALQLYQDDVALMSVKLQVAAMLTKFQEAEDLLKKLRVLNVEAENLLFMEGFIRQKQGNHEQAMALFADAASRRGNFEKALQAMLASAQAAQKLPQMREFLRKHLARYTEDLNALLLLARLSSANDASDIKKHLENALQREPNWSEGAIVLAELLVAEDRAADAFNLLQSTFLRTGDTAVGIAYARHLQANKQVEKALSIYEQLLSGAPQNDVVRNNYAALLLESEPSADASRKALQLTEGFAASDNPALLDTYGVALLNNNEISKAIYVLRKAAAASDHPTVKLHYAKALYAGGKQQSALEILEELDQVANPAITEELAVLRMQWEKK